jgi:hypothetical protein
MCPQVLTFLLVAGWSPFIINSMKVFGEKSIVLCIFFFKLVIMIWETEKIVQLNLKTNPLDMV